MGASDQPSHVAVEATLPAVPSTSPTLFSGTRINQYEIIRLIGEGGMGTVYLARDLKLGRRVAIKFLHTNQPEHTERLLAEARTTARCQHDNIIVIHEVGEHDGAPYIVLEYLDGRPLTALLEGGRSLPYTRAVEIMCSLVRALVCAHEAGIVHRDLKPDNIFVTESGTIKVLDFGIAKNDEHLGEPEPDEAIAGTLQYMAPEQWGAGIGIDHLADLWACGILLHQMICGRHPLPPNQLITTPMFDRPMPAAAAATPPGVPSDLVQAIDRCLQKRKEDRWQSAAELLAALAPFLPGRRAVEFHVDESPYAGLSSFQERDADKFFGRSREIAELVTQIRDRPLLAIVGSSGIGKSSFVRAGVIPALKRSGEQWETLVVRPGRAAIEALAAMMHPMISVHAASAASLADEVEEQTQLVERLHREPGHLGHVLRLRARREERRLLLFVDQLEELYTQVSDPADRAAFTACLAAVADDATSPLRVVLSLRADFLDRIAEDRPFAGALAKGLFFLGRPGREGLRDAIANPAEMAGYRFEAPAIADDMLDHLEATPGALPLLQFAAARLWDMRDRGRRLLTRASYAAMGGVAGALASHADRVVSDIGPQKAPLVRAILLRLVTAERTRAIVPLAELRALSSEEDEIQWLIDRMVDARLLVVQTLEGSAGATVEIVHESLVYGWPALRRWLDEHQDDAALVEQFRAAARQWAAKGRDRDLLWRGDALAEYQGWRRRHTAGLTPLEAAFGAASIAAAARGRRIRRAIAAAMAVIIAVFVVGLWRANLAATRAQREAEASRRQAEDGRRENQRLLAQSYQEAGRQLLLEGRPQEAMPYLVAARQNGADGRPLRMLFWTAARALPLTPPLAHRKTVEGAAFSPDGARVVTASDDGAARIWDAATGKLRAPPLAHTGGVMSAMFSFDGARVVTASADHTARVWDATTGKPLTPSLAHPGPLMSAAFSPDGARVVTAGDDGTARIWDAATGAPVGRPLEHRKTVVGAAFSGDGARVVTASWDNTARVWDTATGTPVGRPLEHRKFMASAAFSPDGARVVTASYDNTAQVWDVATGRPLAPPLEHQGPVRSAAFSPDGARVVTASDDGTARIWDAATGKPLAPPLPHQGSVVIAAFSADGARVLTASYDRTARVWDAATGKPLVIPLEHQGSVTSAAFSADGTRIITASEDGTARIWDVKPLTTSLAHRGPVRSAAFSADGARIVTASDDGTARIWSAATGKLLAAPLEHRGSVTAAAFAPVGARVVTASADNTARIWDAVTGEPLTPPLAHRGTVYSAAFSPDGSRAVTASKDGTARIWDAAGKPVAPPLAHQGSVVSAAFGSDGTRVVTASTDNTARVWDAATGAPVAPPLAHQDTVVSAAFSPDGSRVVTASTDHTARVWDAATGAPLASLEHQSRVVSAAFSPDGARVVTAGDDRTARIWDVATGKLLVAPLEHQERVVSAAFSSDGSLVVTASDDRTARVWDAATGKLLAAPIVHQERVMSAAFSPDCLRVVTASADHTARVLEIRFDDRTPAEWSALAEDRSPFVLSGSMHVRRALRPRGAEPR